ncbi:unnamed protein product, partial [Laminaria digitata]
PHPPQPCTRLLQGAVQALFCSLRIFTAISRCTHFAAVITPPPQADSTVHETAARRGASPLLQLAYFHCYFLLHAFAAVSVTVAPHIAQIRNTYPSLNLLYCRISLPPLTPRNLSPEP